MSKLTTADRKQLATSEFALPGRRYPIPDEGHAKAALARVSEFGSHEEKAEVRTKVRNKFKTMTVARKAK